MSVRYALTTVDNPYDPFDEFVEWMEWDRAAGYDTPNYLARIVALTSEVSAADQDLIVEDGIDQILEEHGTTFYKKVSQTYTIALEEAS